MRALYKVSLSLAVLVLLALAAFCGWLFVYTGDLPYSGQLSQFAPSAQATVSDSCLASPSLVVPFDRIGKSLQDAIAAAESPRSLSDQIARSLMCNHAGGMGTYHLNSLRLSWHIRRRFSEQQVFTIYANRAYFGPGMTGVENASTHFFGKGADSLSTDEAALLAGLLRAPNRFSPNKHPQNALERRDEILKVMAAQGKLSETMAPGIRVELDPEKPLWVQVTVHSGAERTATFPRYRLPWGNRYSMVLVAVVHGTPLEMVHPVDDPMFDTISVGPGTALTGNINLEHVIPDLGRVTKVSEVQLFWAYESPKELNIPHWSGGWILIPEQK
jgi:hypothetical protein